MLLRWWAAHRTIVALFGGGANCVTDEPRVATALSRVRRIALGAGEGSVESVVRGRGDAVGWSHTHNLRGGVGPFDVTANWDREISSIHGASDDNYSSTRPRPVAADASASHRLRGVFSDIASESRGKCAQKVLRLRSNQLRLEQNSHGQQRIGTTYGNALLALTGMEPTDRIQVPDIINCFVDC